MRFVIEKATTSFLILSITTLTSALSIKARNNPFNIDYDPAPAPEDGPPLSAGALRNPAYLPAEIGGIIGAYVFVISVVGVALFTVGRRLRLAAERSKQALAVEMIQPKTILTQNYSSPISPNSGLSCKNFSWPSPQKAEPNPYIFPVVNSSPVNSTQSPARESSIDVRVIEADRQNLHKGLEDLYAHVMAHEEAKAANKAASTASLPQPPLSPLPMQRQPLPQTSPQRQTKNSDKSRPLTIDTESTKAQKTQSRTSSLMSSLSRKKSGVRNMQISSPIPTPLSQTFSGGYASDEEPLSPVHYSPPPPPPIPKDQVPYTHSRNNSSATNDPSPVSPAQSIDAQLAKPMIQHSYKSSQVSVQQIPPMANPLQANSQRKALMINTDSSRTSPAPSQPPSNNGSTRTLPFRAFDPPAGLSSPTFSQATKTTVLERKGAPALMSPGLRTPWTAGAVPYSPYQPQTPLTPYTPTLVTKQDRKIRKKLEGRAPVLEMIKSEEELWDSGY